MDSHNVFNCFPRTILRSNSKKNLAYGMGPYAVVDNKLIPPPAMQRPNPKKKHGAWGLVSELTITSPYVHSRVDYNTFSMGNPLS
jgi:hypothetical protein